MSNVFSSLKNKLSKIFWPAVLVWLSVMLIVSGYQLDLPFLRGRYIYWEEIHGFAGYVFISAIAFKAYTNWRNLYISDLFIALLLIIVLITAKAGSFGSTGSSVVLFRFLHAFISVVLLSMLVLRLYKTLEKKNI